MTHEYNADERALSREIRSLQQLRAYHARMVRDKDAQIMELQAVLRGELVKRGVLKKS